MVAIINAFVIFAAALLLALVPTAVIWRTPHRPRGWRYAALLGGHGFACLVLLLLLNGQPGYFGENADVQTKLALFDSPKEARQPFVLIDNSGNKQVVPDPDGNAEDSTVRVVTDRAKLTRLLQRFAAHQEDFAQVVVDIAFTDSSPNDSALREAVLDLAMHQKVLLARAVEENTPLLRFGSDVMADVTENEQDGLIAWHNAARDEGHSLPYALYLRLHQRKAERFTLGLWKECGPGGCRLVYGGFMPTWAYLPTVPDPEQELAPDALAMPIGHALDMGWPRLLRQLRAHDGARKAVVFIGEFPAMAHEGSTDQHRTFLGESRGSAMLIGLHHEIGNGAHVLNGLTLLGLFAALVFCTWLVIARAWQPKKQAPPKGFAAMVLNYVWDAIKTVIPLFVLVFIACLIRRVTGQQMNLIPMLIYFITLIGLVKAVRKARPVGSGSEPPGTGQAARAVVPGP